jgi:hypothetical protein
MKIALPLSIAIALLAGAAQAQMKLPELKKQPSPQAVLDEHFAALNACDWDRLLAQYPDDAQINLPNGVIVKGARGDRHAVCRILHRPGSGRIEGTAVCGRALDHDREHVRDAVGRDRAVPGRAVSRLGCLHYS